MSDAKVRLSMTDGLLEVEGTEAFVTAQLDRFDELIKSMLTAPAARVPATASADGNGAPATAAAARDGRAEAGIVDGLENVFAIAGEDIQILKEIPGVTKSEKTGNAARLLLFGMKHLKNKEVMLFEDLKKVCERHGFYDGDKMAGWLKADKSSFVFGGSGRKQTAQLTVPGAKSAAKLFDELKKDSAEAE